MARADLKYIPANEPGYTINHRIEMCEAFEEGCELEDAVRSLIKGVRILRAWDDFHSEVILLHIEQLCRDYCTHLRDRQVDWEEYNEFPEEVYKHFLGGARKLTQMEYHGEV